MTLMRGPRHGVLLDEPALGQDAAHKATLMRLTHALADAGQLVILTTHDLALAAEADQLLILATTASWPAARPPRCCATRRPGMRWGCTSPIGCCARCADEAET